MYSESCKNLMLLNHYPHKADSELHDFLLSTKNICLYFAIRNYLNGGNSFGPPIEFSDLLDKKKVAEVLDFFQFSPCYVSHVPKYAKLKLQKTDLSLKVPYLSYDTLTSINAPHILDAIFDPRIVEIVKGFLGENYVVYSINTFWTLPSEEPHFTHGFHRDEDGFNFLTMFIRWTDIELNDGHLEYIDESRDLSYLNSSLKQKNISLFDFYNVNHPHTNGYTENQFYEKIFDSKTYHCGKSGSACMLDTWGLHRGSPIKKPRLVTWIRFSRYKNTAYLYDNNRVSSLDSSDINISPSVLDKKPHLKLLLPIGF